VVVEGVNIIKKHQRARSAGQQSEIIEREAPIHWSNVMLVDPNDDEPTRVAYRKREDGTWVRVGKRSGEDIE
jgi:large subunit ribosomal protein L24